ncbi:PucR family transcriptional regulator [Streptomyces geranii]|uniref:PucR family transcriptional regulator n=1 Tax=Streptomyces geranii TaxID=2058923 RepID=UPI0018E4DF7D|nr:helix-turn-helix domain-containing protein [Streptomyces geranii]
MRKHAGPGQDTDSGSTPARPDARIVAACDVLLARSGELADGLARLIMEKETFYADNFGRDELAAVHRVNIDAMLTRLAGRPGPGLDAPRETGRLRTEQGVPLSVVLRAYRLGGTYVWERLVDAAGDDAGTREAMLAYVTQVWGIIDDFSQALTERYREADHLQDALDARRREGALAAVLTGHVTRATGMRELAQTLGLPRAGQLVVVAAAATPGAGPLADIERTLTAAGVGSAWRTDLAHQVGIVGLTGAFSMERLCGHLSSIAAEGVGVSERFATLEQAPRAHRQARLAMATAGPGQVVRCERSPIAVLLAGEPEMSRDLMRSVLGPLLERPDRERDMLLDTLRAWFREQGSASGTARSLCCHRNTVRYRLAKVTELTGRELQDPVASAELYCALEAERISRIASEDTAAIPVSGRPAD